MIQRDAVLREGSRVLERLHPARNDAFWEWVNENIWRPIGELVEDAFRTLRELTGDVPAWLLLGAVAFFALALVVWLAVLLFRRGEATRAAEVEGETLARLVDDPGAAEAEAERLAAAGRFGAALRLLYFATFARLHHRSGRPFDPSLTPGENLRPYRRAPYHAGLRDFVRRYQEVSFGRAPLDRPGYDAAAALRPAEGSR